MDENVSFFVSACEWFFILYYKNRNLASTVMAVNMLKKANHFWYMAMTLIEKF